MLFSCIVLLCNNNSNIKNNNLRASEETRACVIMRDKKQLRLKPEEQIPELDELNCKQKYRDTKATQDVTK